MTGLRRSDGGERYLGTDHGAGDGDAEDVDQEGGVDGDLSVFETSEVFGEWEDAVPGDGGVEGVRFVGMYVQDGCWRRWIVLISFVCRLTWADRKQDAVAHWSLLTIRMSFYLLYGRFLYFFFAVELTVESTHNSDRIATSPFGPICWTRYSAQLLEYLA